MSALDWIEYKLGGFRFRAVKSASEDHPQWLGFIALPDRDFWLAFGGSEQLTEEWVAGAQESIVGHRIHRLILWIGEPWEGVVELAPEEFWDLQRGIMWSVEKHTYDALMEMSPEKVEKQRGFEELDAINREMGNTEPPSMN